MTIPKSVQSRVGLPVQRDISPQDEMLDRELDHDFAEEHYFGVGRSTMACLEAARLVLGRADDKPFRRILELPCGHGRILRHLRAAYPDAELTACDLNLDGVEFCARTFGAIPIASHQKPERIALSGRYDLICVISLVTHFDAALWPRFLRVFGAHLADDGLLLFTTHGEFATENMFRNPAQYRIRPQLSARLARDYKRRGFGYINYAGYKGYGLSVSSPEWVLKTTRAAGLRVRGFFERALDNHHDVWACQPQTPSQTPSER